MTRQEKIREQEKIKGLVINIPRIEKRSKRKWQKSRKIWKNKFRQNFSTREDQGPHELHEKRHKVRRTRDKLKKYAGSLKD